MDYDDNDAEDQNLHLAGEGSSKVSPVLCPYALPKFDFDDSLHGHLRFDSLVENEVFLGITSQEDYHWIEEYSRGTSVIQFSSDAAESRHKNVWSEATSSESVEMLLKSVGQEERCVEETITEGVDACDEPGNLANVMDPNLKQCDGKDNLINIHNTIEMDEFQETFVGSKASSDCEQSHAKFTSQSQETQISGGELDSVGIDDRYSLSVADKKVDKMYNDVDQKEASNLANESFDNRLHEHPSVSKVECGNAGALQNVNASLEESRRRKYPQEVPERGIENASGLSKNFSSSEAEHIIKNKENSMDNLTYSGTIVETCTCSMEKPSVVSNVESMDKPLVEVRISADEELTSPLPTGSCDMQIVEGCNAYACSAELSQDNKSAVAASFIGSEINQELNDGMHEELLAVSPNGGCGKMHAIDDASTKSDIPGSPKSIVSYSSKLSHVQSSLEVTHNAIRSDGQQFTTDACMVSAGNSASEMGEGSDINDVGTSAAAAFSSAELPAEDGSNKDVAAGNDAPEVHTGDSNDGDQSLPAKLSGIVQVGDEAQSLEPGAVSMDRYVPLNQGGDAGLPLDSTNRDVEAVGALDSQKNVEPSSSVEGCKGFIEMAQESESNIAIPTDAVAAVELSKISSPDTSDGVPLPSGSVAISDIVTEDRPKSPILGVSLLLDDNEEKTEVGFSGEGSSQKETLEVENMVDCALDGPLSVVEKGEFSDCAEEVVQALAGHCDPPVENCNTSSSEQATQDNPGGLECSKTMGTSPLPCNSSAGGGNNADVGDLLGPKESVTGQDRVEHLNLAVDMPEEPKGSVDVASPSECDANHMAQDGGGSASLDKPHIFSLSDTNNIGFSQSEKSMHEVAKGSMYENAPISEVQSVSLNSATKEERNFTLDVSASAGPGPTVSQDLGLSKVSSVNSSRSVLDPNNLHEGNLVSPQTPSSVATQAGATGDSEGKPRRKSVGKESAKKGNHLKEKTPVRRSVQGEKSPELTPPATGHVIPSEELKPSESLECSISKPSGVLPIPTSSLPDLNNSTSIFKQSFTVNQQVELRAQILVYGSLISGMPPEEPHMIAAFGPSDGGRRAWEGVWHAYLERVHGHKSLANNSDTPMESQSGNRDPDQGIKIGSTQSKVLSPPISGLSNMAASSMVVSPMIPISSPLWNISTPCDGFQSIGMPRSPLLDYQQLLSPLHPYQTPQVQNFAGHHPPWLSQGPFPGQWVASSPISAFSARFSALPTTEAVKLTTVKESGGPGTSAIPVDHSAGSRVSPGSSSLSNMKKATALSGQPSSDPKSRKRKKVAASVAESEMSVPTQAQMAPLSAPVARLSWAPHMEGYSQISFLSQNRTDSGTAPVVSSHSPTSVALSTPVSVSSESNPSGFLLDLSPASVRHPRRGDQNIEKVATTEVTLGKIEVSKLQAEDAAVHAAAAVGHCQDVWSQLERQKNSGLVSDDEAKLASSAVSIAAASSVAKVAAAAAKIASNVAEQARLMAEEVFLSSRTENFDQGNTISFANVVSKDASASILKSADRSDHPNLVISAAREAARRRIKAASAASKHAENLDAIVKAAELAAEAVSQAGKIVAMGNSLPLKALIEAGAEGYWKTPQLSNQQGYSDKKNVEAASIGKEIETPKHGLSPQKDSGNLAVNQITVTDGISGSITSCKNNKRMARARKGPDLSETFGVIPEPESETIHTSIVDQNMCQGTSGTWKENNIKEGCLVEVYKDDNKYKSAWFAANVLTLKDGKAFVCYTEIQSDEGSEPLKEWVPLEVECTEAPRVRIAHPMTTMQFEGTGKRRRRAMTDYAWCNGDHVDVWVQDCWREGVVMETNKTDATSLTVQFSAQGETSVVRSWHVRPTLIWKDGKWIEWLSLKGHRSSEGDAPQKKRPKLGSPNVEGNKKDKPSKNIDFVESGIDEESRRLPVSAEESSFDAGKTSSDENKLNTHRTMRSGLQKEGPRVVFGVPKPGKKQKFMDVSKHYVAGESSKNNTQNDSDKLSSYLMPQAPGARGSKNNSKIDSKEKKVAETKSKVLKSRKPPIPSVRTLAQKDKSQSGKSTSSDAFMTDKPVEDSVGVENLSVHQNRMELGSSNTDHATEGPSSTALPLDAPKENLTSKAISQRLNKGKFSRGGGKAAKVEPKEKSVSEIEPRRSNRRIQPTSRLLEGLQSSLTISRIPAVSHASQRSHKVTSKGTENHG